MGIVASRPPSDRRLQNRGGPSRRGLRGRISRGAVFAAWVCAAVFACAGASDRRDPLQAELDRVKARHDERGPVQCKAGTRGRCYSGPQDAAGRGICIEGTYECDVDGYWSECVGEVLPRARELCNGLDDDCNGIIDDGFTRPGTPCTIGLGECRREGVTQCTPDGARSYCDAQRVYGVREICDGKDNDCDGAIDEDDDTQHVGESCKLDRPFGACTTGRMRCQQGQLRCLPESTSTIEICNGLDDDCNGLIDDGCITEAQARQR